MCNIKLYQNYETNKTLFFSSMDDNDKSDLRRHDLR